MLATTVFNKGLLNPWQRIKPLGTNLWCADVHEAYGTSALHEQGSRKAGAWWWWTWNHRATWTTWGKPPGQTPGGGHMSPALSSLCLAPAFVKPSLINITDFCMSKRALEVLLGGGISVSSGSFLCSDVLKPLELF